MMEIPKRIIVVDDDSINNMYCRYIIKEALENVASNEESEIVMFAIPQKALNYINSEYLANPVPTLIFLDINMPVLSGWDVLEELERSEVVIKDFFKIYILSSSVDPVDKERADNSPLVSGFLEKPLDVNIVRSICGIV